MTQHTSMQRWLAEEVRSVDQVRVTYYWPDCDVVFSGGFLQPEGYGDPTLVLMTPVNR